MKTGWRLLVAVLLALLSAGPFATLPSLLVADARAAALGSTTGQGSWYFAVSGDSRDCGDLIMPKIAHSIEGMIAQTPVSFYWHLGDFRRMFDIDCDMLKGKYANFDCKNRSTILATGDMDEYLNTAWDDFVERQIVPFGQTTVFLGIGNHELYANRTRDDYRRRFQKWLTQGPIHAQRMADSARHLYTNEGEASYHFVKNGVDFIYLDNADATQFDAPQIKWLTQVLANDATDSAVTTIVVGMHAALPFSTSRSHAMDASCQGICSGQQVYDLLFRAQHPREGIEKRVYVMASHSHYFQENVYDTPQHKGRVIPGWIIGTAGAEQYTETIRYGYLLVEVRADGTIDPRFVEVTRDSTSPGYRNGGRFVDQLLLRAKQASRRQ